MPSPQFIQAALDQETDEIFVLLVSITAPGLAEPIRVCSGGDNIVSNGEIYAAYPFEIVLPGEQRDQPASGGRIRIDNVDPEIVGKLRALTAAPSAVLKLCLASQPNVIDKSWSRLKLHEPAYDLGQIEVDLKPRDFSEETFPKQRFSPARTPGLF